MFQYFAFKLLLENQYKYPYYHGSFVKLKLNLLQKYQINDHTLESITSLHPYITRSSLNSNSLLCILFELPLLLKILRHKLTEHDR